MPRTASTHHADRAKPRPQPPVRQRRMLDSTPVLFRLPAVEQLSLAAIDDDAASQLAEEPAATDKGGPSSNSSRTSQANTTRIDSPQSPLPHGPAALAASSITGERLHASPQLEPNEFESLQLTASGRETRQVDSLTSPATQPATTAQAKVQVAPEQSWWEHWSSGVVLILLIIALITASIMAFNDTSGEDAELLADGVSTAADVPLIPNIELPPSDSLVPNPPSAAFASPAASSLKAHEESRHLAGTQSPDQQSSALASSNARPAAEASPAATANLQLVPADLALGDSLPGSQFGTNNDSAPSAGSGMSPSTASGFVANSRTARTLNNGLGTTARNQAELQPAPGTEHPLASLDVPVGIELPALFPSSGAMDGGADEANPGVTAVPASTSKAGPSPSLYDGAMDQPNHSPALPVEPPAFTSNSGTADTRLPPYSAVLPLTSASQPAIKSVALQNEPTNSEPAPTSEPKTGASSAIPGVRETLTPDSDAEAFIKAWQQFNAMNNAGGNRYPSAAGTPASGAQPPTAGNAPAR